MEFDRSFTDHGHRLVYDVYGSSSRPVVVYLHGLLLDAELNRGIAQALAEQGYRVVLLDLLGHGRSDKPTHVFTYRIDSYAEQVIALLDHLGVEEAVLGGISLGANVSLFAATRYPERTRALILEMPVLERAVPAAAMVFVPMVLAAHYGRRVMNLTSGLMGRIPPTRIGPLNSVLHALSVSPTPRRRCSTGCSSGRSRRPRRSGAPSQVPTLVLAHRNDVIHPFDDAVGLVGRMPNAVLIRARSPLELRLRPKRLTGEIVAFLSGLDPASMQHRPHRSA